MVKNENIFICKYISKYIFPFSFLLNDIMGVLSTNEPYMKLFPTQLHSFVKGVCHGKVKGGFTLITARKSFLTFIVT